MPPPRRNTETSNWEYGADMTYLRFGIKLKLLRLMLDLTQVQAAQKLGMKLKDYQHLEAAQNEPRSGTMLNISEKLLVGCKRLKFDADDMAVELPGELVDKLFTRQGE